MALQEGRMHSVPLGPQHACKRFAGSGQAQGLLLLPRGPPHAKPHLFSVALATAPFSSSWRKKPRMGQSSLSYSSTTSTARGHMCIGMTAGDRKLDEVHARIALECEASLHPPTDPAAKSEHRNRAQKKHSSALTRLWGVPHVI